MTREEAIKIIESNCSCSDSKLREACAMFVPELAESEDERIRKILIHIVKGACDKYGIKYKGDEITEEKLLAYLEKQKEQKPWEWNEEERKILDSIIDDYEAASKSFCGYDGKIGLLRAIRDGEYNLPKPAEWSEQDEMNLYNIIEAITYTFDVSEGNGGSRLIAWLKSHLRPQSHWKPSEEEVRLIKTSISFLKYFADKGYENAVECIDWLKSKLNGNSGK